MTVKELERILGKLATILGDDVEVAFQNIDGDGGNFTEMPVHEWEARPDKVLLKG